jgi:integrase
MESMTGRMISRPTDANTMSPSRFSAPVNPTTVQRMLGHASAVMTLDVYAGLFDDDLDAVAARLDASAMEVEPVHSAEVIALPRSV